MKKVILIIFLIAAATTVVALSQTERDANRPGLRTPVNETDSSQDDTEVKKKRLREGMDFKGKRCFFRTVGNRVSMFAEDETERFVCLENLNLERIMQAVQENPMQQIWKIDGIYTEYLGENFVFIKRATLAPQIATAN